MPFYLKTCKSEASHKTTGNIKKFRQLELSQVKQKEDSNSEM